MRVALQRWADRQLLLARPSEQSEGLHVAHLSSHIEELKAG
jgi:hypothetical protein